jgi:hypothetical protein
MTLARRGQEIADTVDDPATRLSARQTIGWLELFCGEPAGIEKLTAVLDQAARADLDALVAATYVIIVRTACRQRRYDLAEPYLQAGIEFCTTRDYDIWRNYLLGWQAKTALARGRWTEAADTAALCLPAPCPFGRIHRAPSPSASCARRGDPTRGNHLTKHWPTQNPATSCNGSPPSLQPAPKPPGSRAVTTTLSARPTPHGP